ncbi:MAG TPA: DUF1918 domain-containing protein [Gaiellaceae bacterium]|nr:DUF1918 domain-containing protein [Gaiellaceae bacterium]
MAATHAPIRIRPGDVISLTGRHVGDTGRTGEVVDVLGEEPNPHYRVRWEDGHESVIYPTETMTVVRSKRRQR